MCHCLVIKDNKGKIHYAVILMFVVIIAILFSMIIEKRVLLSMRDRVDNELVIAAFSGAVFDLERLYDSVKPMVKQNESVVEYEFGEIYQNTNIYLDHKNVYDIVENILANNMVSSNVGSGLINDMKIETLIVYNMYDTMEIHRYYYGNYSYETIDSADKLHTPNEIVVDSTGIYVKIEFSMKGFLGINRKYYLEKCILLEY